LARSRSPCWNWQGLTALHDGRSNAHPRRAAGVERRSSIRDRFVPHTRGQPGWHRVENRFEIVRDAHDILDPVAMGIADLSDMSYPLAMGMQGITIKLPEAVARRLREEARQSGRSVAALIRERIEAPPRDRGSVYAVTTDLAGSLAGRRLSATNTRARFRRP
jgi:ribbon-helix-helix CopG family protein